jgi:hypothetical protein
MADKRLNERMDRVVVWVGIFARLLGIMLFATVAYYQFEAATTTPAAQSSLRIFGYWGVFVLATIVACDIGFDLVRRTRRLVCGGS